MELTITLDGLTRTYNVDDNDVYNHDWNEKIRDMLDSKENAN